MYRNKSEMALGSCKSDLDLVQYVTHPKLFTTLFFQNGFKSKSDLQLFWTYCIKIWIFRSSFIPCKYFNLNTKIMSMSTELCLTDTPSWCTLFLFLAVVVYHIRAKYLKPYHFTDDEKELLMELLDERLEQKQLFFDSELKEDIYLLKQKIKR